MFRVFISNSQGLGTLKYVAIMFNEIEINKLQLVVLIWDARCVLRKFLIMI